MIGTGILIIDDEPGIRRTLALVLEDEQYKVFTAEDAITGMEVLAKENIALIFLDVLLPRVNGLEALEQIRRDYPHIEVIMISGHANVDMAIRAIKLGAFDFLEKPVSLDKILTACRNALSLKNLKEENIDLKKNIGLKDDIQGTSPEINNVRAIIRQAAAGEARILISGENGTGKELAARAIHRLSGRSDKPFITINCAAVPDTLIESELLGHEKDAFDYAYTNRKGCFEAAFGGTFFLDKIDYLSLAAQEIVLKAIKEQKIERVGGKKAIDIDVRILAAAGHKLEEMSGEGSFNQELFSRLNAVHIRMPPLRERKADIPFLLFGFLEQFSSKAGKKIEIEESAMNLLSSYYWPGNISELKNFAERLVIIFPGIRIDEKTAAGMLKIRDDFSGDKSGTVYPDISGVSTVTPFLDPFINEILGDNFSKAKDKFEKLYLEFHFSRNNGIISRTAEAIGIYPSSLHSKLRKYGIKE